MKKHCRACHGFCPSGVLDNGLCLDCDANRSPEQEDRRTFARALAALSPFWRSIVLNNEAAHA